MPASYQASIVKEVLETTPILNTVEKFHTIDTPTQEKCECGARICLANRILLEKSSIP